MLASIGTVHNFGRLLFMPMAGLISDKYVLKKFDKMHIQIFIQYKFFIILIAGLVDAKRLYILFYLDLLRAWFNRSQTVILCLP